MQGKAQGALAQGRLRGRGRLTRGEALARGKAHGAQGQGEALARGKAQGQGEALAWGALAQGEAKGQGRASGQGKALRQGQTCGVAYGRLLQQCLPCPQPPAGAGH